MFWPRLFSTYLFYAIFLLYIVFGLSILNFFASLSSALPLPSLPAFPFPQSHTIFLFPYFSIFPMLIAVVSWAVCKSQLIGCNPPGTLHLWESGDQHGVRSTLTDPGSVVQGSSEGELQSVPSSGRLRDCHLFPVRVSRYNRHLSCHIGIRASARSTWASYAVLYQVKTESPCILGFLPPAILCLTQSNLVKLVTKGTGVILPYVLQICTTAHPSGTKE